MDEPHEFLAKLDGLLGIVSQAELDEHICESHYAQADLSVCQRDLPYLP